MVGHGDPAEWESEAITSLAGYETGDVGKEVIAQMDRDHVSVEASHCFRCAEG